MRHDEYRGAALGADLHISESVGALDPRFGWSGPSAIHRGESEPAAGGHGPSPSWRTWGVPTPRGHHGPDFDYRIVAISVVLVFLAIVGFIATS